MSSLTFQLPEEKAERLTSAAQEMGVPVEDLLARIASDFLGRKEAFDAAANYVLAKNAELYRRLAR
jgi:antitoxin FitA